MNLKILDTSIFEALKNMSLTFGSQQVVSLIKILPEIEMESSISSLYTKDMNRVEFEVGIIMVIKCHG